MADVLSIRLCLICLGASDYACTKVTCIFMSSITLILCYFIFSEGLIQMWATVIGLHRGVSSHQGCIYSDLCETEYHLYYSSPALSSLYTWLCTFYRIWGSHGPKQFVHLFSLLAEHTLV